MDVAAWLRSLGMERYERAFRDNAIDGEVLPNLTADDLKELGVASIGHRRKLLDALATLRRPAPQASSPSTATAGAATNPPLSLSRGERRQVAVMFADLSGFTALSRELDAEELHATLDRYFEIVDRLVERHGGHIDKHIGDSVMAVFGAPLAYGDDLERAMRAALAIRDAVPTLSAGAGRTLSAHIGVASGQVVASGAGSASHREYTVTGETVNLAARLTDAAGPGEILISDAARRALSERLDCAERGALQVKGFADPVRAWRLLGLSVAASARPFVGRAGELAQLGALLAACAETGRGGTVYLRGEAGIGKTRLVEELQRASREAGFACHAGHALDFGARIGRDAVRLLVRDLVGLSVASGEDAARAAAAEAIKAKLAETDDLVFLNDLLDVPQTPAERSRYDAMDNAMRVRGRRDLASRLVERASRIAPRLLVVEDLHWASGSTLSDLASLAASLADSRALLVMTSRLEGDPIDGTWRSEAAPAALTTIDLGPLPAGDARRLAAPLSSATEDFINLCIERAGGNPLFLEQLLRHSQQAGRSDVPGSVQSLAQARLDRLDPADKAAAQAASVLGQRIEPEALEYLLGERPSLDRLAAQLMLRPQKDGYIFHHALIRDAVYDGLLKARRRELHLRAAEWYDGRDASLAAEHLNRAEDSRAARAYFEAARAQAEGYRYEAAQGLIECGLRVAVESADRFALQLLLGDVLHDLGDMPAALTASACALEAATSQAGRCRALIGLAKVKRVTDDLAGAWADLDAAEAAASADGLVAEQARIHFLRGNLCFPRGETERCVREHGRSLALAREAGDAELEAAALGGLGDAEYMRGRMVSAYDAFDRCIVLCERHGLMRIEMANRPMRAMTAYSAGRTKAALEDALAGVSGALTIGHRRAQMVAHHAAFHCLHALTEWAQASAHAESALAIARQLGAPRFEAEALAFRAEVHRIAGRRAEALSDIDAALAISRETGMAYLGPYYLGILAHTTQDSEQFAAALAEGDALLAAGAVSHNHYLFHRDAIDASLERGLFDLAEEHVAALEAYAAREPSPWSAFHLARARALIAHGRGNEAEAVVALRRLKQEGEQYGYLATLPAIEIALVGRVAAVRRAASP